EERHYACRLRHQPRTRRAGTARGDPASLFAPVPAYRDDDNDGIVERRRADAGPGRRFGTATAARLFDGRRAGGEPGLDAVHHPGDLPLSRPFPELVARRQRGTATAAGSTAAGRRVVGAAVSSKLIS